MKSARIEKVIGREILDSRGNPTVEAEVYLESGAVGRAAVPSGASTGAFEARELRDGGKRYGGKGVKNAVHNINTSLCETLRGRCSMNQRSIDAMMIAADGSGTKENFGANAILAVSLANAKAAAAHCRLPVYQYLGGIAAVTLPVPMMNVINGGKHADSSLNIQEFMIIPLNAGCFEDAMEQSCNVFHKLGQLLAADGYAVSVGDEGGYAPKLSSDEEALDYIVRAVEEAGYFPGEDFGIAIDAAANEMHEEAKKQGRKEEYYFWKANKFYTVEELGAYWKHLCDKYPVLSIEDGYAEEDWSAWRKMKKELGGRIQLVGDDLFVTNTKRIGKGMQEDAANAVLVKLNQIGTLSETIDAIRLATGHGWNCVISHRSGETEDSFIADLAVAMNAGQIKTGAPSRTERTAKYNQLLRISEQLGTAAIYPGRSALKR